jgi:DNA invertase Pin-like site-specific DNA recombinase
VANREYNLKKEADRLLRPGFPPKRVLEAALSRRFGGESIDVPIRSVRRKHVLALAAAGLTSSQIARKLGCTRQWVSRVLNDPA